MQQSLQERLIGALGAAIVVTLFGYLLLLGLTVGTHFELERPMTLLDLRLPPPMEQRPKPAVIKPRLSKASGKASPRNLRNKAIEIVTPPPAVLPVVPPLITSAPKAGVGMAASAGASDRPGPGEGAGGEGNGSGSGGYGDGEGDGGDTPPRQIGGRLKASDLPRDLILPGFSGVVFVHYTVNLDGRVSDCTVLATSGSAELDQLTCRLIEQRFHYEPSRDVDGRPVRSAIEEHQYWSVDPDRVQPRP